jgi:hypothetical protein
VPGYRNSTVHALEICLAIREHPVDKDYFLRGAINHRFTFLIETPSPPSPKNSNNTFSFPTVQLLAVAVYMDKPNPADICT